MAPVRGLGKVTPSNEVVHTTLDQAALAERKCGMTRLCSENVGGSSPRRWYGGLVGPHVAGQIPARTFGIRSTSAPVFVDRFSLFRRSEVAIFER